MPLSVPQDFKTAATGVTAKAMRAELNRLVQGIPTPEYKAVSASMLVLYSSGSRLSLCLLFGIQAFEAEMQSFFLLFNRYLAERVKKTAM